MSLLFSIILNNKTITPTTNPTNQPTNQKHTQTNILPIFIIQKIQDEMEDLLEQANEIQETMGRSYGLPDDLDEADLEAGG